MSSTTTPVGYRAERFVAPAEQIFKLPDGSSVNSVDTEGVITVTSDNSVITFAPQERVVRVSPYGIVNDDRVVSEAVLLISSTTPVTTRDLWVSVYALWLRRNEEDVVHRPGMCTRCLQSNGSPSLSSSVLAECRCTPWIILAARSCPITDAGSAAITLSLRAVFHPWPSRLDHASSSATETSPRSRDILPIYRLSG